MPSVLRSRVLSRFECLGDKCPDTCCQGWSMQMDEATLSRYRERAPELLDAVEPAAEAPWIMRKNGQGFCVKFEDGWCGIHKRHGADFLGDACYFYPRATRRLGDITLMTAAASCPEIARLMLEDEGAFAFEEAHVDRLPHTLKDYAPPGLAAEEALALHRLFLEETRKSESAEAIFLRIAHASRALDSMDKKLWPREAARLLADDDLPEAARNAADPFNLLHALCGLMAAAKKMPPRLKHTVDDMEKALAVRLDWQNVLIHTGDESLPAYEKLCAAWKVGGAALHNDMLRRWLAMQLSLSLYPFSGLGKNLSERITIIGVRLATVRLALMCAYSIYKGAPEETVRIVQSLSRFLDHLADPAFSLLIYAETGWDQEGRMRGILQHTIANLKKVAI